MHLVRANTSRHTFAMDMDFIRIDREPKLKRVGWFAVIIVRHLQLAAVELAHFALAPAVRGGFGRVNVDRCVEAVEVRALIA
jgi:hypothetical protein